MEGTERTYQLKGALEALLFVSDEPVPSDSLAEMVQVKPSVALKALEELRHDYAAGNSGIELREVAGGWRFFTAPAYHDLIEAYVMSWDSRKLTQAALETLAVVAYSQPVTRAGISSVRGVNSDSALNGLVEKGLVREVGPADAPGNPMQYGTTRVFLDKFGLKSTEDLPDITQFVPDEATKALIRQRLGGVGSTATEEELVQAFAAPVEKIDFDNLVFESSDDE